MSVFTKVILFTDTDGRARFREEIVDLSEGTPQIQTSPHFPCKSYRLRQSPVGFSYDFHCSGNPLYVFILGGQMEIILQDGSARLFKPGDSFYSADVLPAGAAFNKKVHGHASRQVGPDPLVTLFLGI
ncbi:cupin domain-containing protein [Bradyrhizobium sp. 25ACV]